MFHIFSNFLCILLWKCLLIIWSVTVLKWKCPSQNESLLCACVSVISVKIFLCLQLDCNLQASLEKEMATHSSVLAWRIPGIGEPSGLPSMGSHRVGHDWSDLAVAAAAAPGRQYFFLHRYQLILCMCCVIFCKGLIWSTCLQGGHVKRWKEYVFLVGKIKCSNPR